MTKEEFNNLKIGDKIRPSLAHKDVFVEPDRVWAVSDLFSDYILGESDEGKYQSDIKIWRDNNAMWDKVILDLI